MFVRVGDEEREKVESNATWMALLGFGGGFGLAIFVVGAGNEAIDLYVWCGGAVMVICAVGLVEQMKSLVKLLSPPKPQDEEEE